MNSILVAIDFSDASQQVLTAAAELAGGLSSRILLLHVIEPMANYIPAGAAMDVIETAPLPVTGEDIEVQRRQLEKLAATQTPGIEVEPVCILGLAADEIVAQAKERDASYIVLGSHGHGALYHLFAGSVVTGVLKHAPVPVLIVPTGGKKAG